MSIRRAVLHCKDVLQLSDRELAAPRKGVCVKQLLDVAPEMQWFGSDSARMHEKCWCHLCAVLVCAIHMHKGLSFHPVAIVPPFPCACT